MAFTLDALAAELGIPAETLAAKGDVVAKWNGYLSSADTKYADSTKALQAAEEKLEQAKREQQAIDTEIAKFGATEASLAELRASNAAYQAAFEEVKKQGFNLNMPTIPVHKAEAPDPIKGLQDKFSQGFGLIGQAFKVQNEYHSVFGKPFSGDIEALANEAGQQRMNLYDYAARKFDFAGEKQKQAQAELQRKVDEGVQAGVNKWKEDHPTLPDTRGVASKHPQIYKPRDAADRKSFANLSPKERIAASVARVRAQIDHGAA